MFFLKCAKSFGKFSSKNTSNAEKYVNICRERRGEEKQVLWSDQNTTVGFKSRTVSHHRQWSTEVCCVCARDTTVHNRGFNTCCQKGKTVMTSRISSCRMFVLHMATATLAEVCESWFPQKTFKEPLGNSGQFFKIYKMNFIDY